MTYYTCPVCGYDHLKYPPTRHNICACCGTQFDLDDVATSHAELRQRWVREGMRFWAQPAIQPPPDWNPVRQLMRFYNLEKVEQRQEKIVAITFGGFQFRVDSVSKTDYNWTAA